MQWICVWMAALSCEAWRQHINLCNSCPRFSSKRAILPLWRAVLTLVASQPQDLICDVSIQNSSQCCIIAIKMAAAESGKLSIWNKISSLVEFSRAISISHLRDYFDLIDLNVHEKLTGSILRGCEPKVTTRWLRYKVRLFLSRLLSNLLLIQG